MLTAQIVGQEMPLYGPLGGSSAAVQQLQQALLELSQAAGWPAVNPGAVTGVANEALVRALIAVVPNLASLDSGVKAAIEVALTAAQYTGRLADVVPYVEQYATYIAMAVRALIMKYKTPVPPPPTPTTGLKPVVMQLSPKALQTAATSKAGAITARAPTGAWRVAVPAAAGLGGLGAGYVEVASQSSPPTGAQVVSVYSFDQKTGQLPFYKDWRYMVPIGVGAAGLGIFGFWWWRR
jgi:hypothetical protein